MSITTVKHNLVFFILLTCRPYKLQGVFKTTGLQVNKIKKIKLCLTVVIDICDSNTTVWKKRNNIC